MENSNQNKKSRKLLRVHKLLLKIHQKLQLYNKISQQTQRKERIEMGKGTSRSIQRIERKDYKSTYTCFTEKRGKFSSGDRCVRICHRRSSIQEQEEKWKYIVFLSRTIQPTKRNYEIYNKELLTIVEALTK